MRGFFHLPHGVPVLETVALHLLRETQGDPAALSRAMVFLPTRRAARALGAAFLRVGNGQPLLLPRMVAIGDIDSNPLFEADAAGLPPAIAPLERQTALAAMIGAHDASIMPDRAMALAAELGALLDEADEAEVDLARLPALAPDRFAKHWQRNLGFLMLATERWRAECASRRVMDPVARRMAALRRMAGTLPAIAGGAPVLAVGITAPAPATVALLAAIAALPAGAVLLPGLDVEMGEQAWAALGAGHPQAERKALLDGLGLGRAAVAAWPAPDPGWGARARLLAQALLPAEALDWPSPPPSEATRDLSLLVAPDSATEARAIALAVREALQDPSARIAVITPDRAEAERVSAALARFGVAVSDSAAVPLGRTPPGALLRLLAQAVARDLAPVPLLSLLRHPLVAGGTRPADFRAASRNFEIAALRGPRPAAEAVLTARAIDPHWYRSRARRRDVPGIRRMQRAVGRAVAPLRRLMTEHRARASDLLRATVAAAEALAATDSSPGAARLWQGPEGAALARHAAACDSALAALAPIEPRAWPDLLDRLLADSAVRTRGALAGEAHPRVEILGVLEARLLGFDVIVLAGLNEGTWPALPDPGPWLSRQQRTELGLRSPDAAAGHAAADFVAAACAAPRVMLSRAERVEGEPAVASRWITRLVALAGEAALAAATDHVALAGLLDRGLSPIAEPRPCPRPALAVRPRALPVTGVETLRRNPYAIYAQRILELLPLPPLDQEADAADWGSLVHDVAARFFAGLPGRTRTEAEALFAAIAETALQTYQARPGLIALWRPRLATLAPWFAATFAGGDAQCRFHAEVKGLAELEFDSGKFILSARADLIARDARARLTLYDFKTGSAPNRTQVQDGRALQLPLSALIAGAGGFAGVDHRDLQALAYARLPGGAEPGEIVIVAEDTGVADVAATAHGILARLVAHYADPANGYRAMPVDDDFAHLSRRAAWGEAAETEEGP